MSDTDATLRYPTCTHNGTQAECWYCSLPQWMFDEYGRLKKEYEDYQWPWSKPRPWLKKTAEENDGDTP